MGHEALFTCGSCGHTFTACEGGGAYFDEYRCVDCDTVVQVFRKQPQTDSELPPLPTEEEIGVCYLCNGKLRNDISPMCPHCKSHNTKLEKVLQEYE